MPRRACIDAPGALHILLSAVLSAWPAEGLVRNLPVFSEFLNMAALSDTVPANFSTVARISQEYQMMV